MSIVKQSTILLTGSLGMLAGDLIPLLASKGVTLVLTDQLEGERFGLPVSALDITEAKQVKEIVSDLRPDWIINCAAYTAVDEAESKQELAFSVNSSGPANLAKSARDCGGKLVHLSTDYVFGAGSSGAAKVPFREDDPYAPSGIYGQSKRFGDELVVHILPTAHLVVRTSWLHGVHGPNFVSTVAKICKEKPEIKVVNDQIGSPTYAAWLADRLIRLMECGANGIFHATSRGNISWYEFAQEIAAQLKSSTRVVPQTTAQLARSAPRPSYSTLDVSKLERTLNEPCITWQRGITEHLKAAGLVG